MQFLAMESARKAVRDLIEFEPNKASEADAQEKEQRYLAAARPSAGSAVP